MVTDEGDQLSLSAPSIHCNSVFPKGDSYWGEPSHPSIPEKDPWHYSHFRSHLVSQALCKTRLLPLSPGLPGLNLERGKSRRSLICLPCLSRPISNWSSSQNSDEDLFTTDFYFTRVGGDRMVSLRRPQVTGVGVQRAPCGTTGPRAWLCKGTDTASLKFPDS